MLQGYFASGRYTSAVLFVLSMLVMVSAHWMPVSALPIDGLPVLFSGFLSRAVALLLYLLSAVLLSRQTFFDREVKWKGALYMWFVAVSTFVNGNVTIALLSLVFLLSVILLLFCQYSPGPVGLLYASFMLLGLLAFISPYALYLIPLYLLFCSITNTLSSRGVAASFLGLLTPFWLVVGTAYVFPRANGIWDSFVTMLPAVADVDFAGLTFVHLLVLLLVLAVLLPAVFAFVGSASPAKPLLRRRLTFVIVANIYLLLLFVIVDGGSGFFYICQLPFVAILASYLFAKKETRLSNVYMIFINLIMVAMATQSLWLMR